MYCFGCVVLDVAICAVKIKKGKSTSKKVVRLAQKSKKKLLINKFLGKK